MSSISLDSVSLSNLNAYSDAHAVVVLGDVKRNISFNCLAPEEDEEFFLALLEKFQTEFHLPNLFVTQNVFSYALKTHRITWEPCDVLSIGKLKRIFDAFQESLSYSGKGISGTKTYSSDMQEYKKIFDFLLARQADVPTSEIWENAKNLLLDKDPAFFEKFQVILQDSLDEAFAQAETADPFILKTFIGNLMCLLPYTDPPCEKVFNIPVCKDSGWQMISYKVERKIALTPRWYSSPLPAFALTSENEPSILTFQGSTFPSGDGFWAALVSDFCLGLPVGRLPSLLGKQALNEWISKQKEGIHAFGVSLGGSVALNVAKENKNCFTSVNVYNPAFFYPWNRRTVPAGEVNIFSQWNDLVSTEGFLPEGENVHVYRALLNFQENFVKSHNRAYSGAENVTYVKTSSEYENSRAERILLTIGHIITPIFLLPIFAIHLAVRLLTRLFELISSTFSSDDPSEDPRNDIP